MPLLCLRSSLFPLFSQHFKKFPLPTLPILLHTHSHSGSTRILRLRTHSTNMLTESPSNSRQLTHIINLPSQLGQPVDVVAAPGVSDSDFRYVYSFKFGCRLIWYVGSGVIVYWIWFFFAGMLLNLLYSRIG